MTPRIRAVFITGVVLAALAVALSKPVLSQQVPPPPDLLTLAKGAVLVSATVDPAGALALTDGDDESHWSTSTKKTPPPYQFVFELLAPAELTAVGIDNAGDRPGGVAGGSAGAVVVEGSAEGPDGPWTGLAQFTGAPDGPTLEPVAAPVALRWLRYTIQGPQTPGAAWVYLDEAIAQGSMTAPDDPDRFTGVFQIGRADFIELKQQGGQVSGCYLENSGRSGGAISGAVQDGVALVSWTSDQGITGTGFLTVDSTGALSGVRYRDRSRRTWAGPVAPEGTTTPCSDVAPVNPIVQALQDDGQARIYGILFEHDSDVPKPSSAAALNSLLEALQSAPDLAVAIEGHTDSDGDDGYNLDLSQRRAAAVVAWLTQAGIAAGRLEPAGRGETQPVASNATADGKALNRRVEVRRR